jgi:dATP pyrophosphohydrolase
MDSPFKIPESVLVVIHTPALEVLLIERAKSPGFWQSVTGSLDAEDEPFEVAAAREVMEETGLDVTAPGHRLSDWGLQNIYEIYPEWRHRYAPGVWRNTERVFGLCIPVSTPVKLNPEEHRSQVWLPRLEAADRCFSFSNAEAVLLLPRMVGLPPVSRPRGALDKGLQR